MRSPDETRVLRYDASDDLTDQVSTLQRRLTTGEAKLSLDAKTGYLRALLTLLKIPISSQTLVFSKTSLHPERVSPDTPRAVYFNDDVYVTWVPDGDAIDISATDPAKGPIFYILDQHQIGSPRFTRSDGCLSCHLGLKTMNVPGPLLRSVVTNDKGDPLFQVEGFSSGHESLLTQRWGGWYVSGSVAGDVHQGTAVPPGASGPEKPMLAGYLSPHSDVVALMVLAHQVKMQNLMTRANYETRLAMDPLLAAKNPPWARQRIATAAEPLLEYMLFRNEAALRGAVQGVSTFAEDFQREGPRDSLGRSLRQLDLKTRLLRYPCSYLIYSESFNGLPPAMKTYLWRRLFEILSGTDRSERYAGISHDDGQAVFEILRETKPDFAAWIDAAHPQAGHP